MVKILRDFFNGFCFLFILASLMLLLFQFLIWEIFDFYAFLRFIICGAIMGGIINIFLQMGTEDKLKEKKD